MYVKDERTNQFAYTFHAAADRFSFVLATIVTPGKVYDSFMLQPLVEKFMEKVKKLLAVAVDAVNKTPAITKHCMRWTTLRGIKKLFMKAMLTFAAMNLKKQANWTWQNRQKIVARSVLLSLIGAIIFLIRNFKRYSECDHSEYLLSSI